MHIHLQAHFLMYKKGVLKPLNFNNMACLIFNLKMSFRMMEYIEQMDYTFIGIHIPSCITKEFWTFEILISVFSVAI